MKKYLVSVILFLLFFFLVTSIQSQLQASGESCNITPAQLSTDGTAHATATLTTERYGATHPTWYAKWVRTVQHPDGTVSYYNGQTTTASFVFGSADPNHDFFTVSLGPFNSGDEGNYTVYFNLSADVGSGSYATSCQFSAQSAPPPAGIDCPTYISLEPPETTITSASNIQLKYQKNNASLVDKYEVKIFENNNIYTKTVGLTESGTTWIANIGNLAGPAKVYSARLIYKDTGQVCWNTNISVDDSRTSGSFGAGHNPCDVPDPNDPNKTLCNTAFGYISTDITKFAQTFLSIAIGVAGGIALILLVFGSIRVLTSSGNQQTLAAGRDTIIAAIAGLLFLIFSVLILRAIGIVVGVSFL